MNAMLDIPLTGAACTLLNALHNATASEAIASLTGATLLGERAMLRGMKVPGLTSANGSCHLLEAIGDRIALNLGRVSDLELLPALFEDDAFSSDDPAVLAAQVRAADATQLTARGRLLGLAIAREGECPANIETRAARHDAHLGSSDIASELTRGSLAPCMRAFPRVLDLSALWAGPLAAHLLWLAGAEVVRVEHRRRPDAMREGDATFFGLLNQGKASVVLDFNDVDDRRALLALIEASDIVVEAARPRALQQAGVDAARLSGSRPGLVWITITGHGAEGQAADWIGFGDDCGVAGGLSAELRLNTGRGGFVGDAIADPLTGIAAALVAWTRWQSGSGGRMGLAMSQVVAQCLRFERDRDAQAWAATLGAWAAAHNSPFPVVQRRPLIASVSELGADTGRWLSLSAPRSA